MFMKRIGNLYPKIYNLDNLILADKKARLGKSKQKSIIDFDKNKDNNIINIYYELLNEEYITSEYKIFKIYEGKERIIYQLPYKDRIVHHGIMNILEPIFISTFTKNTYSCIKKRGIHKAHKDIIKALKNKENALFCLKIDIKKFYPSINHNILKYLLRKKFKDKQLLNLLFSIIDSAEGVPIGNYLSQFLANFYLSYFDHWLKEIKGIKYCFRYCDDIVILGNNKQELHRLLVEIKEYLKINLKLEVKSNHQVFPIKSRGIDFIGYVYYDYNYIQLRKGIKKNFIKMIKYNKNNKSIASYNGWLNWCNSINLKNKYLNEKR